MTSSIMIINGPNLNLLGQREPHIYGTTTLNEIEAQCAALAKSYGLTIDFRQSNHEGQLVDWIQHARTNCAGIIINAGAYTHTSVAIHDALKALMIPIIEVHLSNTHAREAFRHQSFISPVARAVICGLGAKGYAVAIDALADMLKA